MIRTIIFYKIIYCFCMSLLSLNHFLIKPINLFCTLSTCFRKSLFLNFGLSNSLIVRFLCFSASLCGFKKFIQLFRKILRLKFLPFKIFFLPSPSTFGLGTDIGGLEIY